MKFRRSLQVSLIAVMALALILPAAGCAGKKKEKRGKRKSGFSQFDNAQLYDKAMEQMRKKRGLRAEEMFKALLARPMDIHYTPLAQLRLADNYFLQGGEKGWTDATVEYRKFLRSYPRHEQGAYAQYQLAMCYYKMIETPHRDMSSTHRAVEEFQKLIYLYPQSQHVESARQRIQQCRRTLAESEFLIGRFYYKQSKYAGALARLEKVVNEFSEDFTAPELYYYLAETYWALDRKEEGERYFRMVMEQHPASKYAKTSQERLKGKPNRQGFWDRVLPPYL